MTDETAAPSVEPGNDLNPPAPSSSSALDLYGPPAPGPAAPPASDPAEPSPNDDPGSGESSGEPGTPPNNEPEGPGAATADDPDHGEPESEDISSVSELIEHFELEPDWFDGLTVPVKINGEQSEVAFSDLVKSYRTQEAAEQRLAEAKQKSEAAQQDIAQQTEQLQEQIAIASSLIEAAETQLNEQSSEIDWDRLKKDDPGDYSAKKLEFQERRERLETAKREAADAFRKAREEHAAKTRDDFQKRIHAENDALLEAVPEWHDGDVAKAEKAKLVSYLTSVGFDENDIKSAADHRLIVMARKAMLYDEAQKKVDTAKKKVAKVPKTIRPGTKNEPPADKPRDAVSILYPS